MQKPGTTEDIFSLLDSSLASVAVGAALETGLFKLLSEKSLDVAGVADNLGIPLNRCSYWLQYLESLGLLRTISGRYSPTAVTRKKILETYSTETWAYLAREARERFGMAQELALRIIEPEKLPSSREPAPPAYFRQMLESPRKAREFTRMLCEIHEPLAEEVALHLDMEGVKTLLDLGGGSGVISFSLLRRHPGLTAAVADIPNVCAAGREIAAEKGMEDRISYLERDFILDDLPGGFDMVLKCDVGHNTETLFRKLRKTLNPGGRLVVVGKFAVAEKRAHPTRIHWAFLSSLESEKMSLLTPADIRSRLEGAGFEYLSLDLLPSRTEERWSEGWELIEARKYP